MKREHYSYIMMVSHLCVDFAAFALIGMVPFFVTMKGMNYTQTAGLMLAMSIFNAIPQPFFGILADKKLRPWLMSVGLVLSGSGIAALGFLNNYVAMIAAVAVASLGMAIYHPDAGKIANYIAGKAKGKGVSNFSFGGNLAGFIGPVLAVFAISRFGLQGTWIFLIPTIPMAIIMLLLNGKFMEFAEMGQQEAVMQAVDGQLKDNWGGFGKLFFVTCLRSVIMSGMSTFIPLFWLSVLMQPEEICGLIPSVISVAGAAATFYGGRLADKVGFTKVIQIGLAAMVPCMVLISYTRNVYLSLLFLIPAAFALNLAYSPSVVLGQKLIPNHIGFASGITMGLASSFGGVISPMLGNIGDTYGLSLVMWIIVGFCVLTSISTILLPKEY